MKSKIYLNEEVVNKDRRFGSALTYFPVIIIDEYGDEVEALFTETQIKDAKYRAKRNPEDIPEDLTFWERLFK